MRIHWKDEKEERNTSFGAAGIALPTRVIQGAPTLQRVPTLKRKSSMLLLVIIGQFFPPETNQTTLSSRSIYIKYAAGGSNRSTYTPLANKAFATFTAKN